MWALLDGIYTFSRRFQWRGRHYDLEVIAFSSPGRFRTMLFILLIWFSGVTSLPDNGTYEVIERIASFAIILSWDIVLLIDVEDQQKACQ